jgi:lipopolysaccharide/colanic/teichoic acid biosynthesis glycosyltransferase
MDEGKQLGQNENKITRVGKFLRVSRIDELPQLWNVLRGDLSLIGPRPEFPKLVELYHEQIPYYNMRHLIKPGLSGWAQVHHDTPPQSIEETKEKLSYDLYYLKNRSIALDLKIALKTIKTLLSRTGI